MIKVYGLPAKEWNVTIKITATETDKIKLIDSFLLDQFENSFHYGEAGGFGFFSIRCDDVIDAAKIQTFLNTNDV